ncbi:lytic transglycosylase domain-containing protein [Yersinia enterocolitica]|nr:conjugal transfer protein [Yersinia enterocolitica]
MQYLPSDMLVCIHQSAKRYQLPEELIIAVIRTEGGKNGVINYNKNGSVDLGIMQINDIHLARLKKYGIRYNDVLNNTCTNIEVGTWILRQQFGAKVDYRIPDTWWKAVGNYHSKTAKFNSAYQKRVWSNMNK